MLGGIYTDQHCPICDGLMHDNGRNAVVCSKHRNQRAVSLIVRFGRGIYKRFTNYEEATRFLNGLRFKYDEGTFDVRDYQKENPLGFANLSQKWLTVKKGQLKKHSWDNLNNYIQKCVAEWGNRNIKEVGYAEIEDFIYLTLAELSSKSKSNAISVLRSFFDWVVKRRILPRSNLPDLPEVSFELEFRKTIDKEVQESILNRIRELSWSVNPRIWVAVKWLSTYISIRPGELIRIKEAEIDRNHGFLMVPHPKEKRPKIVPLTDEDTELVQSLPASFGELAFFRHLSSRKGVAEGEPFGNRYLYKWWMKACDSLGIEGVDLYGGTRHSTVIHLGEFFTPEQLKAATFHSTNKAFERYFRVKPDVVKGVYEMAQTPSKVVKIGLEHHRNTVDKD